MLIHGLGATKASLFEVAAALAREGYRVHALDLPGFGGSSKYPAPYGPDYFVRIVGGVMDALGIDRAHFVGNSMGGRVAIEMGLAHPERVGALALLCPAVAFVKREVWVRAPTSGCLRPTSARSRTEPAHRSAPGPRSDWPRGLLSQGR